MAKKKQYSPEQLTGEAPQPPGFMRSLGGGVLSGLNMAGNVLDLPGSMVRDAVSGRNPFDQLLTPHTEDNRTTGRELNRMGGLAGRKDTYGNWWGGLGTEIATDPLTYLGGIGVAKNVVGRLMAKTGIHGMEAARIATKAGQAGKLAGLGTTAAKTANRSKSWIEHIMPSGINWVGPREAQLLTTPGHVKEFAPEMFDLLSSTAKNQMKDGVHTPFDLAGHMDTPIGGLGTFWPAGDAGIFGTGKGAQKIARGLDVAGDIFRHSKIPGTAAVRPIADTVNLLNKKAGGAVTPEHLQDAYHLHAVKEGARYEHRLLTAKWTNDLERLGHSKTDALQVRDWFEFPHKAPSEVQPLVHEVRQYIDKIPKLAEEMGVKIGDVTPKIAAAGSASKYFPRFLAESITNGKGSKSFSKLFDPHASSELARMPWTMGSVGGTKAISGMAMDASLESLMPKTHGGKWVKWKRKAARDYIQQNYGSNLPAEFITGLQGKRLKELGFPETVAGAKAAVAANPDLARKLSPKDTYRAAARSLAQLSPESRKAGIYANHPLNDFAHSISGTADKLQASKVALDRMVSDATAEGPGTVSLPVVLKNLDLEFGDGATKGALKYLKDKGIADPEKAHLPGETAQFLTQMAKDWTGSPEESHAMVELYDNFTKIMRSVFTNMDPVRYNVRNRMSGLFANWMSGLVKAFDGTATNADQLMKGHVLEGASKNPHLLQMAAERGIPNLDDARATEMLREIAYATESGGGFGLNHEAHIGTGVGSGLADIKEQMPGAHPFSWGEVGQKALGGFGNAGTSWNPLSGLAGVGGAEKTRFALPAAGEDISRYTEGLNRLSPMWALIQDGVHPVEAARRVAEAQVDYRGRNYTKFEQQVLKRLVLFYSFSKGMFPFTIKQLMDYPGGRLAQTLRGINKAKGDDELVPQHVAETASIPVPELPGMEPLEKGAKRYITGFGLGFEDPAKFVGGPQSIMLQAASRLNPAIKAPLEWMSGQSFFQHAPGGGGRSLDEMDPALGRTLANVRELATGNKSKAPVKVPGFLEHLLSNSPLSGVLNKARTITDPRKGMGAKFINLNTGVKATDVSPAAQDRELRNRIAQIEKQMGGRTYTDSFLPKDVQDELSPKELEDYRKMVALRKLLEERSKARKK